jgi:hypothetical protein
MTTFLAEAGVNGSRIVDEYDRVVMSGITTYESASTIAGMLNSGLRFPGRRELLAQYNRAKRNDRNGAPRVANGKTCNSPIKGVKAPVINSSRPRGY